MEVLRGDSRLGGGYREDRQADAAQGQEEDSFEEYLEYVFPADDESAANLAKFMANAYKWKAAQGQNGN